MKVINTFTVKVAMALGVLGAVSGTPALASNTDTLPEEKRGAVIGGIIGASVGGPIGAGAGAMIGGGLVGKAFGVHRINGELEDEVADSRARMGKQKRESEVRLARLKQELSDARAAKAASPKLPIQFRTASSSVENHYQPELAEVARMIAERPDATVSLAGYADRRGEEEYNLELSQERVEAVKRFLVEHGVARSQIVTEAFGETKPVAEEATAENHFFDRRVVLQVSVDDLPLASR